jgi:hypothetical protein
MKKSGVIIFILAIFFAVFVGFYVRWYQENYLAEQAARKGIFDIEKYRAAEREYVAAMTADTYGGKTPEETLQLFIDALKAGDIELASKYFALETNTQDPDYLTRNKIVKALQEEKQKGRLQYIADILSRAIPDPTGSLYESDYGFVVYEKEKIIAEINMEFNKESSVWKIQSL